MIMSLASGVIPANRFIYGFLNNDGGFHARTVFQKNLGFLYQNKFLPPSTVRFVTNQKLRLLNSGQIYRLCKWRDGFNHVAASVCAASSFNDSVGDFKDCGRVEEVKKEAANGDGSDTSTGYGHGNGDSRGNRRGGGDNGGAGSGGLGESDDWEGLRWFCWQIYKAWKYYNTLTKLSSSVVAGVGNIQAKMEGCLKEMFEPNFEGLDQLLVEILGLLLLPFALIAVAFCATLFAGILLFCFVVVAALIWFWRSRRSRQP